jgi:hypothetical protein
VKAFTGWATKSKVEKLYIVKADGEFCYVGITSMAMATRLRCGFKPKGGSGYYGYAWQHLKRVDLYVWRGEQRGRSGKRRNLSRRQIEAVEAELAYIIRNRTGRWPRYQTEIHFRNPPGKTQAKLRRIAQSRFEQLRLK